MNRHTRYPTQHRQRLPRAEQLQAWRRLLEAARTIGAAPEKDLALEFAGLTVRIADVDFPLEHDGAQRAAVAFEQLARAYVASAVPELKAAFAEAMATAARCCERLIEFDVQTQTASWRRQTRED